MSPARRAEATMTHEAASPRIARVSLVYDRRFLLTEFVPLPSNERMDLPARRAPDPGKLVCAATRRRTWLAPVAAPQVIRESVMRLSPGTIGRRSFRVPPVVTTL
jgi:hypothetical protein